MEVNKPELVVALCSTIRQLRDTVQRARDGQEGVLSTSPRLGYVTRQLSFAADLVETAESQLREALGEENWQDLNVYMGASAAEAGG